METVAKRVGWTLAVAAAHVAFIIGWTLAIGVGGALLITAGFAMIDWIMGVARWENGYAAHLGQIGGALMTGLAVPAGAALALWRFQTKHARTFNTYSLDDVARIGVTVLCYTLGALLIVVPLYFAIGQALHAVEAVEWAGPIQDTVARWSRLLRGLPLLAFAAVVMGFAEQARRR